jgi:hypothetical protein
MTNTILPLGARVKATQKFEDTQYVGCAGTITEVLAKAPVMYGVKFDGEWPEYRDEFYVWASEIEAIED